VEMGTMPSALRTVPLLLAAILVAACTTSTQVDSIDLTGVEGGLVLAYTDDTRVRTALEEQLVADLRERGVTAYASYRDLPELAGRTPADVIAAARTYDAATVLVVDPVDPGASSSQAVQDPARISPEHPDLEAFFAYARAQAPDTARVDPAREVLVEANLFLLQDAGARLFWSGVAMTRVADGSGAGIRSLSTEIADALVRVRQKLRGN
jgi:hypothetical protein